MLEGKEEKEETEEEEEGEEREEEQEEVEESRSRRSKTYIRTIDQAETNFEKMRRSRKKTTTKDR